MGSNGWKTTVHVEGRKTPLYPVMAEETEDGHYRMPSTLQTEDGDREIVVHRNGSGYVVLFERSALPLLTDHCWREDGSLELIGRYSCADLLTSRERTSAHLVVRSRAHGAERAVPIEWNGHSFRCLVRPAAMTTLAGAIPLAAGRWDFFLRRQDPSEVAPDQRLADLMVKIEQSLVSTFPQEIEKGAGATTSRPRRTTGSPCSSGPPWRRTPEAPTARSFCVPSTTRRPAARRSGPPCCSTPSRARSTRTVRGPSTRRWSGAASPSNTSGSYGTTRYRSRPPPGRCACGRRSGTRRWRPRATSWPTTTFPTGSPSAPAKSSCRPGTEPPQEDRP